MFQLTFILLSSTNLRDDNFEWNDIKNAKNLAGHGVSFERARLVFSDGFVVEKLDDRFAYDEYRFIAIGMVDGVLLQVAYVDRGERRHIITARRAMKNEQNEYFKENGGDGSRGH